MDLSRTYSARFALEPQPQPQLQLARRARIHRFEVELAKRPQIELTVTHHFAPGVYMRSMFIPAGVALVGHIHKHACISIVQYGDILVATENGTRRLVGPCTLESPAGTKRAGWALKNTLFTTIHANPGNWRDVDRLEDFLIARDYDEALPSPTMGFIGGSDAAADS